ncbi:hypothetical protein EV649_5361 [Kribbella sp. VKM Ac-2569]|nr:hypothetical protein EV649_5361 [Kribbella sp. VKM Ac-2569]
MNTVPAPSCRQRRVTRLQWPAGGIMNGEPYTRTHCHRRNERGNTTLAALGGVAVGVILVLLTWLVVLMTCSGRRGCTAGTSPREVPRTRRPSDIGGTTACRTGWMRTRTGYRVKPCTRLQQSTRSGIRDAAPLGSLSRSAGSRRRRWVVRAVSGRRLQPHPTHRRPDTNTIINTTAVHHTGNNEHHHAAGHTGAPKHSAAPEHPCAHDTAF